MRQFCVEKTQRELICSTSIYIIGKKLQPTNTIWPYFWRGCDKHSWSSKHCYHLHSLFFVFNVQKVLCDNLVFQMSRLLANKVWTREMYTRFLVTLHHTWMLPHQHMSCFSQLLLYQTLLSIPELPNITTLATTINHPYVKNVYGNKSSINQWNKLTGH